MRRILLQIVEILVKMFIKALETTVIMPNGD